MATFELVMPTGSADEMAELLEHIADLIRDGFTSGYPCGGGHWATADLLDDDTDA